MIGVIGAMEEEVKLLADAMTQRQKSQAGVLALWTGFLGETEIVLVQSGIGKVNAAAACTVLLERYRPTAILNTGSAGGLVAELSFGDLVIASGLLHHDVDVTPFGYAAGQVPGLPAIFATDAGLNTLAAQAFESLRPSLPASLRLKTGLIGSGDSFVHDPQAIAAIRHRFPSLVAVEMEGAAIAQVCHLFQTPFLAIRAISDVAGKESPMKFEEFLPLASRHSALMVQQLLKEMSHG